MKKFDYVCGNPPYQVNSANGKKTKAIWQHFVKLGFELVKDGGYVALIHPAGWRNVDGIFEKTKQLILSKDVEYLEIHDVKDGQKVFNASTRYDWYVIKNQAPTNKPLVKFQDGSEEYYDLKTYPFIPNINNPLIAKLIFKDEG